MNENILKKVKRIELATRKVMDDYQTGGFKSHFKGQGVQFSEHRVYTAGDDVRHIDWKVSARSKEPLLKQYEEERELNVLIVADLSHSLGMATQNLPMRDLVTELSAVVAYAASNSGDKVGAVLFTHAVSKVIELKKGKNHVRRIIRDLLAQPMQTGGTALKEGLEEAARLMKNTGIIFVLSDFKASGYEAILKRLAKRHDLVAIKIEDPHEFSFAGLGTLSLEDAESGKSLEVSPSGFTFKNYFQNIQQGFEDKTLAALNPSGAEILRVKTNEDYIEQLLRFFQRRKKRR